jgi:hypothetical protein
MTFLLHSAFYLLLLGLMSAAIVREWIFAQAEPVVLQPIPAPKRSLS